MTDRDQVAREVLTELANWNMARVETLKDATRFRDERYPAPAAPVTVTVEGVTWTKQGDPDGSVWIASVGGPPSRSDAEEFLDRIASDARRIEELEAANASLKAETDRISAMRQDALGELVRVGHERDEARRALEAAQSAGNAPSSHQTPMTAALGRLAATGASAVPPRCGNPTGATVAQECRDMATATSQGERLGAPASTSDEAPNSEVTGGGIAAASPAPAPRRWWLVVEKSGYPYVDRSLEEAQEIATGDDKIIEVVEAAALEEVTRSRDGWERDARVYARNSDDLRAKLAAAERNCDVLREQSLRAGDEFLKITRERDAARTELASARTVTREQVDNIMREYHAPTYGRTLREHFVAVLRAGGFTVEGDA